MMMTDGYWNGAPSVGDIDSTAGSEISNSSGAKFTFLANSSKADRFHSFISACDENFRLVKLGTTVGGGAGITCGWAAQSRIFAL